MATKSALMIMEGAPLCPALNESQSICPEVLGTIYTAHYRYVLGICRRFFRQPEDAEDAAAEVFVKLYRVLHQKDERLPFRPWVSQVAWRHCIDKLRQTFDSFATLPTSAQGQTPPGQRAVNSSAGKIQSSTDVALLQTNELLRNRSHAEHAPSNTENDDVSSQSLPTPQFAT